MENFSVIHKNYGHWDIVTEKKGRIFRIRGVPGKYLAMDERERTGTTTAFKTISACITFITDELMFELILAEGQQPIMIEKRLNQAEKSYKYYPDSIKGIYYRNLHDSRTMAVECPECQGVVDIYSKNNWSCLDCDFHSTR